MSSNKLSEEEQFIRKGRLSQSIVENVDLNIVEEPQISQVLSKQNFNHHNLNSPQSIKNNIQPLDKPSLQFTNNPTIQTIIQNIPITYHYVNQNKIINIQNSQIPQETSIVQNVLDLTYPYHQSGYPLMQNIQFVQSKINNSKMPQSLTPLIYSKIIPQLHKRFSKNYTAKLIIIKLKIAQARDSIQDIKRNFFYHRQLILQQSSNMLNDYYFKYVQFKNDYSIKMQQSLFLQKQEYQILKYQYQQILKNKQKGLINNNDKNNINNNNDNIINNNVIQSKIIRQRQQQLLQQLQLIKKQNIQLKRSLQEYLQENKKLNIQTNHFKTQIIDIQNKMIEIKVSNDKLYQFIFDLEQKIAYYQEEMIKLQQEGRLKEQIGVRIKKSYDQEIQRLKIQRQKERQIQRQRQRQRQMQRQIQKQRQRQRQNALQLLKPQNVNNELKIIQLKAQISKLTQNNTINQLKLLKQSQFQSKLKLSQQQIIKLKQYINNLQQQLQHTMKQIQMKNQILFDLQDKLLKKQNQNNNNYSNNNNNKLKDNNRNYNEQINKYQGYNIKSNYQQQCSKGDKQKGIVKECLENDEKKNVQALEIEKFMLQKQVQQLRAQLQFQDKQPATSPIKRIYHHELPPIPVQPQKQYHFYYPSKTHKLPSSTGNIIIHSSSNYQKEISSNNQSQRKYLNKYKSGQYYSPKTLDYYNNTNMDKIIKNYQKINHNQYGMKNIAINQHRAVSRYNNTFQRAASPHRNDHQRGTSPDRNNYCSFEAQQIINKVKMRQNHKINDHSCQYSGQNSKDYQDYQYTSPNVYIRPQSPRKQQKSISKMKLIEQKVRRLKSQLRTTLSSNQN